ncbi:MAG: hypothetical protein CM1200mP24_10080 [Gammaproteobacteria bacterium]|nr:MAG: hypothetical protein CM1200mP24_10080 [Gammaproteobacteria bacterium]
MAGTDPETWHKIRDRFQLIAAKAKTEPCAIRMGNDGAGHFVKMVHNGKRVCRHATHCRKLRHPKTRKSTRTISDR